MGSEEFSHFFRFFSFFFAVSFFSFFFVFLRFSSLFFAFLRFLPILLEQRQTTAIYWENGEFHSDPVCTDPVRNFPTITGEKRSIHHHRGSPLCSVCRPTPRSQSKKSYGVYHLRGKTREKGILYTIGPERRVYTIDLDRANGRGRFGSQAAADPPWRPQRTP